MATAPVTPLGIGLAAGNVLSSIGLGFLSAHHQKAVQNEQNVLGANVPACRQSMQKTMDNFSAGMIDAGTAISQLQKAVDDFKKAVSGILKQSGKAGQTGDPKAGGKCNAACVWIFTLQGEADDLKKQINAGSGGNPSAKTGPGGGFSGGGSGSNAVQRSRGTDAAGNGVSEFSILPGLQGKNLALALGGIVLFLALLAIAGATRKRGA